MVLWEFTFPTDWWLTLQWDCRICPRILLDVSVCFYPALCNQWFWSHCNQIIHQDAAMATVKCFLHIYCGGQVFKGLIPCNSSRQEYDCKTVLATWRVLFFRAQWSYRSTYKLQIRAKITCFAISWACNYTASHGIFTFVSTELVQALDA